MIDVPVPLLVTSGDPAGIGPEVTHKAIKKLQRRKEILSERPIAVIGDAVHYARHLDKPSGMHTYNIVPADDFIEDVFYLLDHLRPEEGKPWRPFFLDCGLKDEKAIELGKPSRTSGDRAATYLAASIELLVDELADAVCTAPICKEVMDPKDFPFPGQTELFADVCEVENPVMMLVGGGLKVALATIHVPLSKVPKLITRKLVKDIVTTTEKAMREDFGIEKPRIAVCGLNPHAGENGKFGGEDKKVIEPALKSLQKKGMEIEGPLPADSLFAHARDGKYDAVVAMYHDQGLIPVKTLAFYEGVNTTLGLQIVRTAPDHGTAFDIAGKNEANPDAMLNAIRLANEVANRREALYVNA